MCSHSCQHCSEGNKMPTSQVPRSSPATLLCVQSTWPKLGESCCPLQCTGRPLAVSHLRKRPSTDVSTTVALGASLCRMMHHVPVHSLLCSPVRKYARTRTISLPRFVGNKRDYTFICLHHSARLLLGLPAATEKCMFNTPTSCSVGVGY